jgi:excisionase family DNA binding protein
MDDKVKVTFDNMPQAMAKVCVEVSQIKNQLEELQCNFEPKTPTEYLTRKEVADFLKADLSTIHNWTVKGKLKAYGIGNRVYYKRAEVEQAIKPLK